MTEKLEHDVTNTAFLSLVELSRNWLLAKLGVIIFLGRSRVILMSRKRERIAVIPWGRGRCAEAGSNR